MNVPCPKCQADIPVPKELMQRGVAHVKCEACSFAFVVRLGDPGSSEKQEENDEPQLDLEGVKTSGAAPAAAGEIGSGAAKFIAAETRTTIYVDPQFQDEIEHTKPSVIVAGQTFPDEAGWDSPAPLSHAPTLADEEPTPADEEPTPAEPSLRAVDEEPTPILPVDEEPTPADEEPTPAEPSLRAVPTVDEEPTPVEVVDEEPTPVEVVDEEPTPAEPELELVEVEAIPIEPPPAQKGEAQFEGFKSITDAIAPPPGAEVPKPPPPPPPPVAPPAPAVVPPAAAPVPVAAVDPGQPASTMPTQPSTVAPAGQVPAVPVAQPMYAQPQPSAYPAPAQPLPEAYHYGQPSQSKGMRVFGLFLTLALVGVMGFFLFVLYKNNWSLDVADFGGMVDRAFGSEKTKQYVRDELRGLEVDRPIVGEAKLVTGDRVLTVEGVVRNTDTRTRRFIYVRAIVEDNHGRKVTSVEAPAGNVFSKEQLAKLTKAKLSAQLNPAGRDGRNAKLESGQSIAYMVVVTSVPHDYSPTKYTSRTEVSQAELYDAP